MNESIKNTLIPIGVAWVGVSVVIGLVIVLLPLSKQTKLIETRVVYLSGGAPIKAQLGESKDSLGTKVRIKGTIDPSDPGQVETKVKILK